MDKKCRSCIHWDMAGVGWGYCKLITIDSEHLGVNLQSFINGLGGELENSINTYLETKEDFYCKLFEVTDG